MSSILRSDKRVGERVPRYFILDLGYSDGLEETSRGPHEIESLLNTTGSGHQAVLDTTVVASDS